MDFPNSPPPADSTDTVAPRPVIAHGEAAPGAKAVEERRERLAKLEAALAAAPWWRRERRNGSILLRWLLFVAGVAAPSLCLLWTAGEEYVLGMGLAWQSGELEMYSAILLGGQTTMLFYPFLFSSMVACTLTLWNRERFGRVVWVRLGLYAGVVLAVQYLLIHGFVLVQAPRLWSWEAATVFVQTAFWIGAAAVALAVWRLIWWATRRWRRRIGWRTWVYVWGMLAVTALLIGLVVGGIDGVLLALLGFPLIALFFATPAWCLAAYVVLSFQVAWRYGRRQVPLWLVFVVVSWLGAWFAAWRLALTRMQAIYATLPLEQPSYCYVALTAAGGHRWLVRGWAVRGSDGRMVTISTQLAWLKLGELALAAAAPGLHCGLRRVYDRWGPAAAARLRENAWLADAAYVSLKPAEWAVRLVLWLLVGDLRQQVKRVYGRKVAGSPRAIDRAGE